MRRGTRRDLTLKAKLSLWGDNQLIMTVYTVYFLSDPFFARLAILNKSIVRILY